MTSQGKETLSDTPQQDSGDSIRPEQHAVSEAQNTLNHQILKIQHEDEKAVRIFRANMIFLSVIASGVAIAMRFEEINAYHFENVHMVMGMFMLFLSTASAAMAYTSSKPQMGLGAKGLQNAEGHFSSGYYEWLSDNYQGWLSENYRTHQVNKLAINGTLVFALVGILFFGGAFAVGIWKARGTTPSLVFLVFEVILAVILGLAVSFSDWVFEKVYNIFNSSEDTQMYD